LIGGALLTPWQVAGYAFALAVYAIAWTWGGRLERFAAAVLVIDLMVTSLTFNWHIDGVFVAAVVQDCVRLLIFGWLCFQSDRWWPLVVATANAMMVFVQGARFMDPGVSHMALASSHVGLLYLADLALLLGVWERWLAGEPAIAPAAWAKVTRITAMRRSGSGAPGKQVGRNAGREPTGTRSP